MSKFVVWLFGQSDRRDAIGQLSRAMRVREDFPQSAYRIGDLLRWVGPDDADLRASMKRAHREYHRVRRAVR